MVETSVSDIIDTVDLRSQDVLLPMIECVVNSIISLQKNDIPFDDKYIQIKIKRGELPSQPNTYNTRTIDSFTITDNGVGFTNENYLSFKKLYSKYNADYGCKGFGRFTILAAYENVTISSIYTESNETYLRELVFNKKDEIKEVRFEKSNELASKTTVKVSTCHNNIIKQKSALSTLEIAERIMQNCLIYYLNDTLPKITVFEENGDTPEIVNDLFKKVSNDRHRDFEVNGQKFSAYVTKTLKAGNRKNNYAHYCANNRVVDPPRNIKTYNSLFGYPVTINESSYFLDVYLVSDYLDAKVVFARNRFNMPVEKENSLYENSEEISFQEIEEKLTEVLEEQYSDYVIESQKRSIESIKQFILQKAPRYRSFLNRPDVLKSIPPNSTEEKIEEHLHKVAIDARNKVEKSIEKFISQKTFTEESVAKLKTQIKEKTAYDSDSLADYMLRRRAVIELFDKFLDVQEDGKYSLEADVHNLIFPMGVAKNEIDYMNHNLWLLDERFINYSFIASDKSISSISQKKSGKEPDLLLSDYIYDNPTSFGDNQNGKVNSMVIFEFKRPGETAHQKNKTDYRWDFSELVDKYFEEFLLSEDKKNFKGNPVYLEETTPKFGYIVMDVIPKSLRVYNETYKGWKQTPFGTMYKLNGSLNLHLEVMTFRNLIEVAKTRHKPFFDKLFSV